MFSLKEKVVYPGHGVARVERIIEKNIGGCSMKFYELTILSTSMTVSIPIHTIDETGIRELSSCDNIEELFKHLEKPMAKKGKEVVPANWSKKNKAYQCSIRSGDLEEVCRIYRELTNIATQKELSFGEKNLLCKTENLLVEEISMATATTEDSARDRLRTSMRRTASSATL